MSMKTNYYIVIAIVAIGLHVTSNLTAHAIEGKKKKT